MMRKSPANKKCPWCNDTFMLMSSLVGFDMEDGKRKIIVWFHPECGKKFADSTKNLKFLKDDCWELVDP